MAAEDNQEPSRESPASSTTKADDYIVIDSLKVSTNTKFKRRRLSPGGLGNSKAGPENHDRQAHSKHRQDGLPRETEGSNQSPEAAASDREPCPPLTVAHVAPDQPGAQIAGVEPFEPPLQRNIADEEAAGQSHQATRDGSTPSYQEGIATLEFIPGFDTNDQSFSLDFSALDNAEVLENFDFDSFLNAQAEDSFVFDGEVGAEFGFDDQPLHLGQGPLPNSWRSTVAAAEPREDVGRPGPRPRGQ